MMVFPRFAQWDFALTVYRVPCVIGAGAMQLGQIGLHGYLLKNWHRWDFIEKGRFFD